MTSNQVAFQNLLETQRSNQAKEAENLRSNQAREAETERSNRVKEAETVRSNREQERVKSNLELTERRKAAAQEAAVAETARHNQTQDTLTGLKNAADMITNLGKLALGTGGIF